MGVVVREDNGEVLTGESADCVLMELGIELGANVVAYIQGGSKLGLVGGMAISSALGSSDSSSLIRFLSLVMRLLSAFSWTTAAGDCIIWMPVATFNFF